MLLSSVLLHLKRRLRATRMRREKQKLRSATIAKLEEEGIGAKIFGIGLSRTGTTSLAAALEHLGYTTAHWHVQGRILQLEDFFSFDAVADTPAAARFEQLSMAFPESKFIYTVRSLQDWKEAVERHFEERDPRRVIHQGSMRGRSIEEIDNRLNWIFIHNVLYSRWTSWEEAYKRHDERVRSFFARERNNDFLEIDIIEGGGWPELCGFLGLELPSVAFPHRRTVLVHRR